MVKPIINAIVDILMGILLVVTFASAYTRSRIHESAAIVFLILVLIHIILHGKLILISIKNIFKK